MKDHVPGYSWYMRSSAWSQKKQAYRDSGRPWTCKVCASGRVHLHHRTYVRFMEEELDDLVPLCEDHHAELHLLQREQGLTVEEATRKFLKAHGSRLVTPLSKEDRELLRRREMSRTGRSREWSKQAALRRQDREEAISRQAKLGVPTASATHEGKVVMTEDGLIRSSGNARVSTARRNKRRRRR